MKYKKPDFIKTTVEGTVGGTSDTSEFAGFPLRPNAPAESSRLETLSEWLRADHDARKRGVEICQQRIRELDPSIHAWVQVQPERPTADGPLYEIPFGAKDIIETLGMATEYGSPIYKGRQGSADAAIIREMRSRGAILLGKTVTAVFAYRTPGPTRNPRNLAHTPGGSSSGSAAAVAAGMVPFAIGDQTRGSMIRPASYCGVTGFKPTFDLLSMEGVLPLAKSLDTLGLYTHTAADMHALWKALGHAAGVEEEFAFGAPQPVPACEPEMANAFQKSLSLLGRAGMRIKTIDISEMLDKLDEANRVVTFNEGARFHEQRWNEYGSRLGKDLEDLIREGLKISLQRYDEARRYTSECRVRMAEIFKSTPVILTPAAIGPAPSGLSSTGDPRMNAPWTSLGTPAISIPMPLLRGLPLGLQLTADVGEDSRLLLAAVRLQRCFSAGPAVSPV